jgi:regulator of protease activity HflC (stomatin/prohibitin superfamily)
MSTQDNRPPLIVVGDLAREFAHISKFVDEQEAAAAEVPPVIEDDDDLAIVNRMAVTLRKAEKRLDMTRDETKRPYLDASNVVQGFFKPLMTRLDAVRASVEQRGTRYLAKKAEAERKRQAAEAERLRAEAARKQAEAEAAVNIAHKAAAGFDAQTRLDEAADAEAIATQAKPADLARTKSDEGTATLEDRWAFDVESYSSVDLEALRLFFGPKDVSEAIARFVKAGGRELRGVRIYPAPKGRFT